MKNKILRSLPLVLALAFVTPVILTQTGCPNTTTLVAGGVYSDPVIFKTNQSILQADDSMTSFVEWVNANQTYLSKWPEIAVLSAKISAQKDGWIKDAYLARNAYVTAADAYKAAADAAVKAGSTAPSDADKVAAQAKLDGLVSALLNVVKSVTSYQTAHPSTS